MVVYVKSEGRLSEEMLERSGVNTSEDRFFTYKCNIFESVIDLIRQLVHNNPKVLGTCSLSILWMLVPRGFRERFR